MLVPLLLYVSFNNFVNQTIIQRFPRRHELVPFHILRDFFYGFSSILGENHTDTLLAIIVTSTSQYKRSDLDLVDHESGKTRQIT